MSDVKVDLSQFEFVVYVNACLCPDEDCNHPSPPREDDDNYAGDFACKWGCQGEYEGVFPGAGGGPDSFILTSDPSYGHTLADVVAWATEHAKTCTSLAEVPQ